MKKILIPTKNKEKFNKIKKLLTRYNNIEIVSLDDIALEKEIKYEKSDDIQENTKYKSQAYADATGIPTLIMETALYLDAVLPDEQPGTDIKKYAGSEADDEQVLNSYLNKLSEIAPEQRTCRWFHAICFAIPNEGAMCDTAELSEMFIDKPTRPLEPGYPLKSILYDPLKQKTHKEYTREEEIERNKLINDKLYAILGDLINE